MRPATVSTIYRYSLLSLVFVVASPLYAATLALLVPVFGCWLYFKDYKQLIPSLTRPQVLFPVLLYIIVFIGFFFADNFRQALSSLSVKIPWLLFPVFISTASVVDSKLVKQAGNLLVIAITVSLFIALAYALIDVYVTGEKFIQLGESIYAKWEWYGLTRIFPNWHPTYVAVCANLAIAILLYNFKKRALPVLIFLSLCIVLINSMIGVVGFFCNLLYAGMLRVRPAHRLSLFLILAVVALGFFYFNPLKIQKLEDLKTSSYKITDVQGERNLLTMRMAKWSTYAGIIKKNWLFGTTEGDIKEIRNTAYLANGYMDLHRHNYNAHNQYLEVFALYGLIGFIIFMCMLIAPFFTKPWHPWLIPFMLITGLSFLTESILERQQGILFFMVLYALFTNPRSYMDN